MENISYRDLKYKYTTCLITHRKQVFFLTSPKEIWEMEISNAREMAENNMHKLRMSQGCTQEA